jgi:ribosomal protein S4
MRKQPRFHGLYRPKLRQTWNKYNFYNIARGAGEEPQVSGGRATFFQQKWKAKAKTRAYHGDHVNEKKWVRMFDPRLRSAVEMPPKYLAKYDGSEQALGTGSGLGGAEQPSASSYSRAPVPSHRHKDGGSALYRPIQFANGNALLNEPLSKITPHVQMTFAPLERRLDTAIFRALFASSVRQARQFCVHGAVKVNGKKVSHGHFSPTQAKLAY